MLEEKLLARLYTIEVWDFNYNILIFIFAFRTTLGTNYEYLVNLMYKT